MTDSTFEVKKEKLSGWKSLGVFILLDVALVLTFGVIGPKANADFWELLSNTAIRYALAGWGISYLVGRTLKRTLILAGVMYVIGLSFILTENAGHADHAHTLKAEEMPIHVVPALTDDEAKKQFDDLYRDSDKLDRDAELALQLPVTNPQQAEMFLIEWKLYHTAEMDIFRRRADIFAQWHKPYPANAVEQEQTEEAAFTAYVDVFSYLADPVNKFHVTKQGVYVVTNPVLYSQKKLALDAAVAKLGKINAALDAANTK